MRLLFSSSKYESLYCLVVDDCCTLGFSINYLKDKVGNLEEWYKTDITDEVSIVLDSKRDILKHVIYFAFFIYNEEFSKTNVEGKLDLIIQILQKYRASFKQGTVLFNCVSCIKLCYAGEIQAQIDPQDITKGNGKVRLCLDCTTKNRDTNPHLHTETKTDTAQTKQLLNLMHNVFMFCAKSTLLEIRKKQCFSCFKQKVTNETHQQPGDCESLLDFYSMFYYIQLTLTQLRDELVYNVFLKSAKNFNLLSGDFETKCELLKQVKSDCGKLAVYNLKNLTPEKINSIRASLNKKEQQFIQHIYELDIHQDIPDMNVVRDCYMHTKCGCSTTCENGTCSCIKLQIPCSIHCHAGTICDHRFDQPKRRFKLPDNDIAILKSPSGWLTDNHMYLANSVLQRDHPGIGGLQDTLFQSSMSRELSTGKFVQFLLVRDNHWITISNINSVQNNINVYDSLYKCMDHDTKLLICNYCKSKKLKLNIMNVQQQQNESDCGVFAIAFAKSLLIGEDPTELIYSHPRDHLAYFMPQRLIPKFPSYLTDNVVKVLHTLTI